MSGADVAGPSGASVAPEYDFDSPACQWDSAFYWWATQDGDLMLCIRCLREGTPLTAEDSRMLADILSGDVIPRSKAGGPTAAKQRLVEWRNREVRGWFDVALSLVREKHPKKPPRGGWRNAAADMLAGRLDFFPSLPGGALSAEQILRIVDTRRRSKPCQSLAQLTTRRKPRG